MAARRRKVTYSRPLNSRLELTLLPDPNMPKRGLSAYMFFANEQRDKVRDDNPGIKFGMSKPDLYQLTVNILTFYRRGRQAAWREVEATQRQAEGAIRGEGCSRQEAIRRGEGRLHCCKYPCCTYLFTAC